MTRKLARLSLRLYPAAFRRRYEGEMRAMIEQSSPRALTILDLLAGALRAHLRPPSHLQLRLEHRLKASMSAILACWVLFGAAGFGFYKTTEGSSMGGSTALTGTHLAIVILAAIASLAMLAGALPLIGPAVGQAWARPRLRWTVVLPPALLSLFAMLTGLLALGVRAHPGRALGGSIFIAWGAIGLLCGAACVIASRAALLAIDVSRRRLLWAMGCATVLTSAMLAMSAATAAYASALPIVAPAFAAAGNGPFGVLSVFASIVVQLVVMVGAGALASVAARRGWRSVRLAQQR